MSQRCCGEWCPGFDKRALKDIYRAVGGGGVFDRPVISTSSQPARARLKIFLFVVWTRGLLVLALPANNAFLILSVSFSPTSSCHCTPHPLRLSLLLTPTPSRSLFLFLRANCVPWCMFAMHVLIWQTYTKTAWRKQKHHGNPPAVEFTLSKTQLSTLSLSIG